jgi:hypothetical protein
MKREVIQDFLNLPGITGIALMDGRSRPYFCGVDQTLNFQQKETLAQGILRVVETIPNGFETFEFQFTGHRVHIYKLEHGIILLVLTQNDLVYSDYLRTIKNLKAVLKEDISNAIATFRLIAGEMPPSSMSYRKTDSENHSNANSTSPSDNYSPNAQKSPSLAQTEGTSLRNLLTALNQLSKFTTHYLGNHVIVNYWKSTRPKHVWLNNFQIDRSAQFSFLGDYAKVQQKVLSFQEQEWIKEWVAAFTKRCSHVIRDFPDIVEQKALSDEQRVLLLRKD